MSRESTALDAEVLHRVFGWVLYEREVNGEQPRKCQFMVAPDKEDPCLILQEIENPTADEKWTKLDWDQLDMGTLTLIPRPTSNWEWAMRLLQVVRDWLFSRRQEYFRKLQRTHKTADCEVIAWPDILLVLQPIDLCQTALDVLNAHSGDPSSSLAAEE